MAMHDMAVELDMAMDAYDARVAEEDAPGYADNGKRLSAGRLAQQMEWARNRKAEAMLGEHEALMAVEREKEELALLEAIAIDAWLGVIPTDQLKTKYGSNDTDRARNTLLMLGQVATVTGCRERLRQAEIAHYIARVATEQRREECEHLRVLALAYGGECQREAARMMEYKSLP